MKFRLGKALWHSSDATSGYEVEIIKGGTVREFIDEVLKNEEWGYIGIKAERSIFGEPYIRYRDDAITTDIEDMKPFLEKKIAKIHASGGWSRMDYLLEVEERGAVDMQEKREVRIKYIDKDTAEVTVPSGLVFKNVKVRCNFPEWEENANRDFILTLTNKTDDGHYELRVIAIDK